MNAFRFLKIVIGILVLLNLCTLTFLWMGRRNSGPPGGPGEDGMTPAAYIIRELQLTPQQKRQYDAMRQQHHSRVEEIREASMQYRRKLVAMLQQGSKDSVAISNEADAVAAAQKQIELVTYYHFLELRGICTPQQQQKFDEIIQEVLQMLAQRQPPPR